MHDNFLQQININPTPCTFKGLKGTPAYYLIHSNRLERLRTQAVDSLESPVTELVVGRGSFRKWGVLHNQNFTLVCCTLLKLVMKVVLFDIVYFIYLFMVNP